MITSVTSSLDGRALGYPGRVEITGYPGDGAVVVADAVVSGSPIDHPRRGQRHSSMQTTPRDVTSLVNPAVMTAGWAGLVFCLNVMTSQVAGDVMDVEIQSATSPGCDDHLRPAQLSHPSPHPGGLAGRRGDCTAGQRAACSRSIGLGAPPGFGPSAALS